MNATFTWSVTALDVYTQEGDNSKVVFNVHWSCFGNSGNVTSNIYGTCGIPSPGETFIPYDSLTQDQVLRWIWDNGVHKADTEAKVAAQIQDQITPVIQTPPLPW